MNTSIAYKPTAAPYENLRRLSKYAKMKPTTSRRINPTLVASGELSDDIIRGVVVNVYRRVVGLRLPFSFSREDVFQQLYLYALVWRQKLDAKRSKSEQVAYLTKCVYQSAVHRLYSIKRNAGKSQGDNKGAFLLAFSSFLSDDDATIFIQNNLVNDDSAFVRRVDDSDLIRHIFDLVAKRVNSKILEAAKLYFLNAKTLAEVGDVLGMSPQNSSVLVHKFIATAKRVAAEIK